MIVIVWAALIVGGAGLVAAGLAEFWGLP